MFRRKVTDELKKWKVQYTPGTAALIEGARRVGKSTVAEEFAKKKLQILHKSGFCQYNERTESCF